MPDYVKLAATAKRLINKSGRKITLVKSDLVPVDVDKPFLGNMPQESLLETIGVFVPANSIRQYNLMGLGHGVGYDDFVEKSSQFIILYSEKDLSGYMEVIDGGVRWGVTGLQMLQPGDTLLLCLLGVKR